MTKSKKLVRIVGLGLLAAIFPIRTIVAAPPADAGYKLVWHDEFNGDQLDLTKWSYRLGPRQDGIWDKRDVVLNGQGQLLLKTSVRQGKIYQGALTTAKTFQQRYGYFEIRCKMPKGKGHWPGFWVQSPRISKPLHNPHYSGSEIDIFESFSQGSGLQSNLHWGGYDKDHPVLSNGYPLAPTTDDYHVIGLEWLPDQYRIYVDGQLVFVRRSAVSRIPQYINLTEECKVDQWKKAGSLPKDFQMHDDQFVVDWVRVYQKPCGFKTYADEKAKSWNTPIIHLLHVVTDAQGNAMLADDVRSLGKVVSLPTTRVTQFKAVTLKIGGPAAHVEATQDGARMTASIQLASASDMTYFNRLKMEYERGASTTEENGTGRKNHATRQTFKYHQSVRLPIIADCWVPLPDAQVEHIGNSVKYHWWLYWLSQ